MFIKQLYTGCLSEAAYYIESEGEAAIIDPLRDIDTYLDLAQSRKARIKYIFETHFHADFVSGHIDLGKVTGAPIVYGPETQTKFPVYIARDKEVFRIGKLSLEVLHTPGHTLESSCYLLRDETGDMHCVFTGDTLFVGDVGRPDLAQKENQLTTEDLAAMLYDSLQEKIMSLPDHVIVYPAHGPGSSCGKNLGPETFSTIGEEKQSNYALQASNKDVFVKAVTDGLMEPPQYFPINARINREGYESLDEIVEGGMVPIPYAEFRNIPAKEDHIVLDTRHADVFTQGFIPGSVNIGLDGRFAEWAGSLLSFELPIYLVTEPGREKESIIRLARVGFTRFKGYLEGGFDAWKKAGGELDMIIDVEADEVAMDIPFDPNMLILDVRKPAEFAEGHIEGALNIPLNDLNDPSRMADFEDHHNIYVHCGGGYRSVVAASLLKKQGIHNLRNISGGWSRLKEQEKLKIVKEKSVLN